MKKTNVTDWFIWGEWATIPWFHSCYIYGLALDLKKRSGCNLQSVMADYNGRVQIIYISKSEWQEQGLKYLKKILANPNILEGHLVDIEHSAEHLFGINKQLLSHTASDLSTEKILFLYKNLHGAVHELWSAGMVPNLLELNQTLLSDHLRSYVRLHAGRAVTSEEWQLLFTPTQLSFLQQEELDFLKLAIKIGKGSVPVNKIIQSKNVTETLKGDSKLYKQFRKHIEDYCWTQYGWMGPALTKEYFEVRLQGILKEKNAQALLKELMNNYNNHSKKQSKSENSLNLDKKHRQLLYLLRRLLFDKTLRVDALYQAYYAWHSYMVEISKRTTIPISSLYSLHGNELTRAFKIKKLTIEQKLRKRNYSLLVKENNKLVLLIGQKAKAYTKIARRVVQNIKAINELKGQIAHPGYIKGRVRLVYSIKDISKVNSGDILVSTATDPSILPAMKKAAGFVTDMGGLTAHAAIVARELKKPCIVGTQVATKILKDGDIIEVDANKGTVKKLK